MQQSDKSCDSQLSGTKERWQDWGRNYLLGSHVSVDSPPLSDDSVMTDRFPSWLISSLSVAFGECRQPAIPSYIALDCISAIKHLMTPTFCVGGVYKTGVSL
jgi:hypothetical protein